MAALDLAPQQVEVLRRRGGVDDLHVLLGGEQQPALDARARMLRPLALEAVGQQDDEAAQPVPLVLGAGDELVDDHLGRVDEIAELSLPEHESVRVVQTEAVLEAEHAGLRQRAVEDLDRFLVLGDVHQRPVVLVRHPVVQHGVALAEGPALAVLAAQPYPVARIGGGGEGERFRRGPVDGPLSFGHVGAGCEEAPQVAVQVESLGQHDHPSQVVGQLALVDSRVRFRGVLHAAADERVPDAVVGLRTRLLVHPAGGGERPLEAFLLALDVDVRLLGLDLAEFEQVLQVVDPDRIPGPDAVVEDGLGEGGFVALVVPAPPVAVEVDDHVAAVALAEVEGDVDDLGDRLRLLAVDVEDRRLEHLRDVRAVGVGARALGRRREADLVVDDDVKRAADVVGRKLRQVERLLDDSLAGKGGVAVDEEQHRPVAQVVADPVLLGAHAAHRHRVDELEVARVERQREVDPAAVFRRPVARVTHVVLHVAAARVLLRVEVLELAEDVPGRLADDVGEHVQAAAVGHAKDDLHRALRCDLLDREVEQGDQALGALERKALGSQVLLLDELLEHRGVDQLLQDPDLLVAAELNPVAADLHPFLQPGSDFQVVDVHELGADVVAVRFAHPFEQFAHRRRVGAGDAGGGHRTVQVALADPQTLELEFLRQHGRIAERVDVGVEVAADPVVADHVVDPALQFDVSGQGGCRRRRRRRRCRHRLGGRGSRGRDRSGTRRFTVAAEQRRGSELRPDRAVLQLAAGGQGIEVPPPGRVERRRIAAVVGQKRFDVVEGEAVQPGLLAHRCLPPGRGARRRQARSAWSRGSITSLSVSPTRLKLSTARKIATQAGGIMWPAVNRFS